MKKLIISISAFCFLHSALALTPVQFNFVNVAGIPINAQFTLASTNILSGLGTNFVIGRTLNLTATNGVLTTNVTAGYYNFSIVGVQGIWPMFVPDTNVTLNALSLITNLPTANPATYPGVMQLMAGSGINLSPTNGQGVIVISSSGGTNTSGISSNAFTRQNTYFLEVTGSDTNSGLSPISPLLTFSRLGDYLTNGFTFHPVAIRAGLGTFSNSQQQVVNLVNAALYGSGSGEYSREYAGPWEVYPAEIEYPGNPAGATVFECGYTGGLRVGDNSVISGLAVYQTQSGNYPIGTVSDPDAAGGNGGISNYSAMTATNVVIENNNIYGNYIRAIVLNSANKISAYVQNNRIGTYAARGAPLAVGGITFASSTNNWIRILDNYLSDVPSSMGLVPTNAALLPILASGRVDVFGNKFDIGNQTNAPAIWVSGTNLTVNFGMNNITALRNASPVYIAIGDPASNVTVNVMGYVSNNTQFICWDTNFGNRFVFK